MYTIRHGSRICIDAPAKINLFLEIRARRSDGYHELETLMVPVSIFDRLTLAPRADQQLTLRTHTSRFTSAKSLPPAADNLVTRTLEALRKHTGMLRGAEVELYKRIPSEAGLGGASADAAAALLGANQLWELGLSRHELGAVAQTLGSDIPFFLQPGYARCEGRGEIITPVNIGADLPLVIVKPAAGLSTRAVYQEVRVPAKPRGGQSLEAALQGGPTHSVQDVLFNRLQQAAERLSPVITTIHQFFQKLNVLGHQMSGSGTSYFAVCRHWRQAVQVAAQARAARLGTVFAATTIRPPLAV